MKLYKGDKVCNCDQDQLELMKKAGWSTKAPEVKAEEPKAEEPKAEEPKAEEPKATTAPAAKK